MVFFKKLLLPGSIERDLLKRHVGPFLICFLTIMFLLLMQFLIQFMDHLVGKGIPFLVILELIMVNLAYMVVLAIPMTILASTLMAYGKFSEHNEYTALRAAGVHPFRIIKPVLILSVLITVFLGWFSNEVLPESNYKARALFLDIRMKKPGFDLQENIFYDGIEGYTFLVRHIPSGSDSLHDITLFQNPEQGRDRAIIKARRGILSTDERSLTLTLTMYSGTVLRYLNPGVGGSTERVIEETAFDSHTISFDLSNLTFSRTNPEDRRRDGRSMRAQAMLAVVDSLQQDQQRDIRDFQQKLQDQYISLVSRPRLPQSIPASYSATRSPDPATGFSHSFLPIPDPSSDSSEQNGKDSMQLPFVVLQTFSCMEHQREVSRNAVTQIRNTQVLMENLKQNMRWRNERIARFMVEVHKKASIPVSCILFAMIGAPLGLLVRKGNLGIHALISTLLFTYYWISIIQGEKLADRLYISPFTGMWFANITIALAAAILLYIVMMRR